MLAMLKTIPAVGLASLAIAAAMVTSVWPAQAHEWLWRDRALPYPYAARDPANPGSGSSPLEYKRVVRGQQSYQPVEPLPWGEMNRRVTPKSGSTQGHEH